MGGQDPAVFDIAQRKALAVRIILGLMLSMDLDHSIRIWDPSEVHLLNPRDEASPPFVSIYGPKDNSTGYDCHSDLRLNIGTLSADEDSDLKPLRLFALLAKTLLHIASGERLEELEIHSKSEKEFYNARNKLRKAVGTRIKIMTWKKVSLEDLPFLVAAQECLNFHTWYQASILSAQSIDRIKIAWHLVFTKILTRIDGRLTLDPLFSSPAGMGDSGIPISDIASQIVVGPSSALPVSSSTETPSAATSLVEAAEAKLCAGLRPIYTTQSEVALFDGRGVDKDSA
jgi:hypothetical protein